MVVMVYIAGNQLIAKNEGAKCFLFFPPLVLLFAVLRHPDAAKFRVTARS